MYNFGSNITLFILEPVHDIKKYETTNSPIHEFEVLQKVQRAF